MATVESIHSHNYQHFDNLQLSAKGFYDLLETMLRDYQFPNVISKRENLKETGVFSASREYLKISLNKLNFLICAAPFGKSFFISWWFQEDSNTMANLTSKIFGKVAGEAVKSKTYFQVDTERIFTTSIEAIIAGAIAKVKADHGFREPDLQTA